MTTSEWNAPDAAQSIVLDAETGKRGSLAEWIERFDQAWANPDGQSSALVALLGPDVVLSAPGFRTTRGREAARRAFDRAFAAFPDLRARVDSYAARDGLLFFEMTFSASVGSRKVEWRHVDRLRFENGVVTERVAFFDPTPIRRAYLASFSGIITLLRFRLSRYFKDGK